MKKLFVLAALLSCGLILFSCSHGNNSTVDGGEPSVNTGENTGGNSGESSGGENETPSDPATPVPETPETPSVVSGKSGVMLQGFNWASAPRGNSSSWNKWYKIVTNNADSIKDTFEYVWCPPPSKTDTSSSEGYGPTELNDLNSCYGTEAELKAMISAISPAKAVADVVVNHRAGSTSWGDFTNPDWGVVKGQDYSVICSDDEGFTGEPNLMGKVDSSKRGAKDTGATYSAYRDLDHTNTVV